MIGTVFGHLTPVSDDMSSLLTKFELVTISSYGQKPESDVRKPYQSKQSLRTSAHCKCFSEACSYLLNLAVICCHLQLEISTFSLMVKGYLVFEVRIFAYEAILQVVLEILEKNNVTQPSQSSDA